MSGWQFSWRKSFPLSLATFICKVGPCYPRMLVSPHTSGVPHCRLNSWLENEPGLKICVLFKMGIFQPAMLVYKRVNIPVLWTYFLLWQADRWMDTEIANTPLQHHNHHIDHIIPFCGSTFCWWSKSNLSKINCFTHSVVVAYPYINT